MHRERNMWRVFLRALVAALQKIVIERTAKLSWKENSISNWGHSQRGQSAKPHDLLWVFYAA